MERHAPCPVRLVPTPEESPPTVPLAALVLFHGGEPDAGERLIHEHRPDGHGRCRGCPHTNTLAPRFPCVLRLIGEATARLHEQVPATDDAGGALIRMRPDRGPRDAQRRRVEQLADALVAAGVVLGGSDLGHVDRVAAAGCGVVDAVTGWLGRVVEPVGGDCGDAPAPSD